MALSHHDHHQRIMLHAPKPKGPRFDAARLPFSVLMKLIQSYRDPLVVERLRLERI